MIVEAVAPEPSVEAFDEGIPGWPTWFDEPDLDVMAIGPFLECLADYLGFVIRDHGVWQTSCFGQLGRIGALYCPASRCWPGGNSKVRFWLLAVILASAN